jgi:hypothetical protein
MALFDSVMTLQDSYGRATTRSFTFNAADFAAAQTAFGTFVTNYAAITGLEVIKYRIGAEVTVADSADAGSNVDTGVTFSMQLADGGKGTVKVPGPLADYLVAGGAVDLADVAVAAFLAHFTSGEFLVSDGEVVTSVIKGTLDK